MEQKTLEGPLMSLLQMLGVFLLFSLNLAMLHEYGRVRTRTRNGYEIQTFFK